MGQLQASCRCRRWFSSSLCIGILLATAFMTFEYSLVPFLFLIEQAVLWVTTTICALPFLHIGTIIVLDASVPNVYLNMRSCRLIQTYIRCLYTLDVVELLFTKVPHNFLKV